MPNVDGAANPNGAAKIQYHWSYDAAYYSAVVDRNYKQLPFILHLPTQFTLLWFGLTMWVLIRNGTPTLAFAGWALLIGALGVPGLVILAKLGIMFKFWLRSSYGTGADFSMSEAGITIRQKSLNGTYPWTTYSRAVRFPDGILLLKPGVIRWLPDSALQRGTVDEAITLVRAHLPIRLLSK